MKTFLGLILAGVISLPLAADPLLINVEFKADYLETDSRGSFRKLGNEIHFGEVDWMTDSEGLTVARMWNVPALIDFQINKKEKTVQSLAFHPKRDSRENLWEAWRGRHAYTLDAQQQYQWKLINNGTYPLDGENGIFYDQYLKELWSYWIFKRLPNPLPDPQDIYALNKTVKIRMNKTGHMQPTLLSFQIDLWHMPVKFSFEVVSSSQPGHGPTVLKLGRYKWKYDLSEWRERHGYKRDLWRGYRLLAGWPERKQISEFEGQALDDLIDRTVVYWVETSIQKIMIDLQAKFKNRGHATKR